tara:strand:+ start:810 stop:1385 length:576 start_codon:yes stop_codon:yes gene_type:complete
MKKAYIGVDPGKAGFITLFVGGEYTFYAMPQHKVETGEFLKSGKPQMKTVFHEEGLKTLIYTIKDQIKGCELHACIEEVVGRQGWSAQNNFNFGRVAGLQKMVLIILNAKIEMVRPQKWQSVMYEGYAKIMKPSSTGKTMVHDTKATSAIVAQSIAPDINFCKTERSKKFDDNKTDSFLLCKYIEKKIEKI